MLPVKNLHDHSLVHHHARNLKHQAISHHVDQLNAPNRVHIHAQGQNDTGNDQGHTVVADIQDHVLIAGVILPDRVLVVMTEKDHPSATEVTVDEATTAIAVDRRSPVVVDTLVIGRTLVQAGAWVYLV